MNFEKRLSEIAFNLETKMINEKEAKEQLHKLLTDVADSGDGKLVCEDCGCSDDGVEETVCPFMDEIYGKTIKVTICKGCYYERSMAI